MYTGTSARRVSIQSQSFSRFFVWNYCPLCFYQHSGRNLTPDKLAAADRKPLFEACDVALRRVVDVMQPEWVVGIGAFAETRARRALPDCAARIARVLHPSPASPAANRDWAGQMTSSLRGLGVYVP